MERQCELPNCSASMAGKQSKTVYCSRAHREEAASQRPWEGSGGGDLVEIAEALGALLAEDRAAGLEFQAVFGENCLAVLHSLHVEGKRGEEWLDALERAKPIWRLGFDGAITVPGSPLAAAWWPWASALAE